jgi:hypothetical protein
MLVKLAHGLNEELTIIWNAAELASELLGPEHPINPAIIELKRSALRCTELARQLSREAA